MQRLNEATLPHLHQCEGLDSSFPFGFQTITPSFPACPSESHPNENIYDVTLCWITSETTAQPRKLDTASLGMAGEKATVFP